MYNPYYLHGYPDYKQEVRQDLEYRLGLLLIRIIEDISMLSVPPPPPKACITKVIRLQ
jgi:hypothetical protein